ncbi:MAG: hypothetical protein DI535_08250 [Citrobacter freundii]|nr:MAG: hypothetical protein DI535_08250 [Citrobacter freundii]
MKARRLILQCASFLLLLVFSQKVGGGLFLHNLLHNQDTATPYQPVKQDNNSREIRFACNCIDDFLMPFTEAEEIVLPQPVTEHFASRTHFIAGTSFRPVIAANLRGPPSLVL